MKKYILVVAMVFALVGCSHSDGSSQANLSNSVIPEFSWLTIDYGQAVAPQWTNEMVVVKSTPQIEKIVTAGEWGEDGENIVLQELCKGVVPLKQDEYDEILQLLAAANLETYLPPEDCDVLVGTTGIIVRYGTTNGSEYRVHTFCELDPEIDVLVTRVGDIANEAIPECDRTVTE